MTGFERAHARLAGSSTLFRRVREDVDVAGSGDTNVMISGEPSVVRAMLAHLIHRRSARRFGPLTTLDCSGLPDETLASRLAGTLSASQVRPDRDTPGRIDRAPTATLFLDNIECTSLPVQDELNQFLETRWRSHAREPSVRVITGTRGNLVPEVTAGTFREGLYYRLNVILIRVPPLGESYEELPGLLEHLQAEQIT
jgi:DNA-binding NtrC family response regulator